MDLSSDQITALAHVERWLRDPSRQTLTLGGYAGTGKTTIIAELLRRTPGAAVCAFTGKAAQVLRTKGVEGAQTLHRLIYQPGTMCKNCDRWLDTCRADNFRRVDEGRVDLCAQEEKAVRFRRVPVLGYGLVIVDEASMLSTKLTRDLESFNVNVLYVGDHGQLEPIGDDPGLMRDPEVRLEQIHRQAAGSEVIQFAHYLREHGEPGRWMNTGGSVRTARGVPEDVARFDAVLCGFNKTRVAVNRRIRRLRDFKGEIPERGERVICLRNDHERGLFNGMLATVTAVEDDEDLFLDLVDDIGNEFSRIRAHRGQFHQEKPLKNADRDGPALFDFGYCLTVHKSQGSEWGKIAVLEQIGANWNAARWRYTAATRAARELVWCVR